MGQIQLKTVLNFKMSHNGHFIAILEFSIVFVGHGQNQPLRGKKRHLCNKLRFNGNNIFFVKQV